MGPFVLGVLVGWLAEWLFYTFWVKQNESDGDCSSLKAELEAKNRQISSLQTQLGAQSNSSGTSSKSNASNNSSTSVAKSKPAKVAKKPAAVKSAPKAKTSSTKRKTKMVGDDFTKLSGIGPSMSATLKELGIDTFTKLASTDDDILRDMLEASDARMNNNKEVMDSWNEQAQVAARGDFATLKKMQEALKK